MLKKLPPETKQIKKAVEKAKIRIEKDKTKFIESPTIAKKRRKELFENRDKRINAFYMKYFCN